MGDFGRCPSYGCLSNFDMCVCVGGRGEFRGEGLVDKVSIYSMKGRSFVQRHPNLFKHQKLLFRIILQQQNVATESKY